MNPKKYQVFVSSTYSDLAEVRRGVTESIQRMLQFPVGMEQFSADDDEQWQILQETIQQTDYYVCIIGHRYGSLSGDGRSFTEREWDYAKERGVPIMSFVRNRGVRTAPDEREVDPPMIGRLEAFIEKVKADKMVDFWSEGTDLNTKVVTALHKAFSRKPRPGWIRAESEHVAEELAALSDENRGLRNQVEKLTSQVANTKPEIELLFNGSSEVTLSFLKDEQLSLSVPPQIKPIVWATVSEELKQFVTKETVEGYNSRLPNQAEIEDKFREIRAVERMQQTARPLTVNVKNTGGAKARQVYVDLVFPSSVLVFEKDGIEDITLPEFSLPENPLEQAEVKLASAKRTLGILDILADIQRSRARAIPQIVADSPVLRLPAFVTRGRSLEVKDNKVTIWMEDLMHTRHRDFAGIVLVAKEPVVAEVNATVICEEMSQAIQLRIPIRIAATP